MYFWGFTGVRSIHFAGDQDDNPDEKDSADGLPGYPQNIFVAMHW